MSNNMDTPDRDQIKGKVKETFGTAEKNLGGLTGDPDLEAQGAKDETAGKAQGMFGKAKNAVGDVADKVKDAFNKDDDTTTDTTTRSY